jgi:hypothetical protein
VLSADRWTTPEFAIQRRFNPNAPLVTLRELLGAADDRRRLTVDTPSGKRQALIAAARWEGWSPEARDVSVWTVLAPSGPAPTVTNPRFGNMYD